MMNDKLVRKILENHIELQDKMINELVQAAVENYNEAQRWFITAWQDHIGGEGNLDYQQTIGSSANARNMLDRIALITGANIDYNLLVVKSTDCDGKEDTQYQGTARVIED